MNLELQFKTFFISFIYGLLYYNLFKILLLFKIKKKLIKIVSYFIFNILNSIFFFYLIYKINGGILNYYVLIFFLLGVYFCKVFYYGNKTIENIK